MIFAETTQIIDIEFVKWELVVLALLFLIAVFIAWGKGFKRALAFLVVTLPLLVEAFLLKYLVYLGFENANESIRLAVAWGPTVLFLHTLLYSALIGFWRGFRKSALLLLHSVLAAAVCIGLYFFLINSVYFDAWLLKVTNSVMGGETALQQMLQVSESCGTLREVLAEYIPSLLGYGNEWAVVVRDNGAYLMTLVDMAYHIVFAILCYSLYLFLIFILYIVYHIAYSERKYKRRKNALFVDNKTPNSYRKRRFAGGLVGLARGLCVGLISLSFLGSAFFIAAGGTGEGDLDEYAFGDSRFDFSYSAYRAVESYGAQGIFKLLNAMQGSDRSPYYLFAADLIFSGNLDDDFSGVSGNVKFRKEIGAYTGFARQTMQLLMKHGGEEIKPILSGKGGSQSMSVVMDVMTKPQFQMEFESLIDDFDAQTYIINLTMSMVNTIVCRLDELSFAASINPAGRDLLKLLFQQGYLCDKIPDERAMLQDSKKQTVQPYINLSKVFTKNDVKVIYRMVTSVLTSNYTDTTAALEMSKKLLPQVQQLSILRSDRKDRFDPVLGRMYCYLANTYLATEDGAGVTYQEIAKADVSWVDEINDLISVAENGITLYQNVSTVEGDAMTKLLSVFDETAEGYAENIEMYDRTCAVITDSKLLGKVLATDYMHALLQKLFSAVSETMYLPADIVYENRYNADGTIAAYGELYQFLYGIRLLGNKDNRAVLDQALSGETPEAADMLEMLAGALENGDAQGRTLADYMTDSVLMRSLISTVMIEKGGDFLYVPTAVCERDNAQQPVQLIRKETLKELFEAFARPTVKDTILSFIDSTVDAGALLKNEEILDLLTMGNGILEGTVAKSLIPALQDNESVVLPRALQEIDGWVSDGSKGELYKIVNAVRLSGIDFDVFLDAEADNNALIEQIMDIDDTGMNALLASDVLYYTVSAHVQSEEWTMGDSFSLIIPDSVKRVVWDEPIDSLIDREELRILCSQLSRLELTEDSTQEDVLRQIILNKQIVDQSLIVGASMADFIVSSNTSAFLKIPAAFIEAGQKDKLRTFDSSNIWRNELVALLDALDGVFGLGSDPSFSLDDADMFKSRLGEVLPTFNERDEATGKTKLDLCYESRIMRHNLTDQLDGVFTKWNIEAVNDEVIAVAKDKDGDYTYAELAALTDSMHVFRFEDKNIMNLNGDILRETAKCELLHMNDPRDDFDGRTGLEVVYPSVIISSVLSHEIDKAVTDDLLEADVRASLKTAKGVYKQEEAAAAIDAICAIGIDQIDQINTVRFSELDRFKDNFDTVYRSGLVAGMITKAIHDAMDGNDALVDHEKAYKADIRVYRDEEVRILIELLDSGDVDDFKLGSTARLRGYVYDSATDAPRSYLLAASLSHNLLANVDLYVPDSVVEDGIVKGSELAALLDAYVALTGGDSIDAWEIDLHVPDAEIGAIAVKSAIIRATLTDIIHRENNAHTLLVALENVEPSKRMIQNEQGQLVRSGTANAIGEAQMTAMLDLLRATHADPKNFTIPTVDRASLLTLSDNDLALYLTCDILRYQIGDLILSMVPSDSEIAEQARAETAFDLGSGEIREDKIAFDAQTLVEVVAAIKAQIGL